MDNRDIKTCRGGAKSHDIFDKIISVENLFLAWKEFLRGKRNKLDIQAFEFNLEDNLFELHEKLKTKTYRHSNYTSFYVRDPKLRHIHKANIRDRVIHHALFRILYPIFDKSFIHDSYSCRMGKGTHRAVLRLERFFLRASKNRTRNMLALKCDIRKFFDSVDQEVLLGLIEKKIRDENALGLIKEIIKSFKKAEDKGLPLGNVTSQLFANIYLNELDQFVKHRLKAKYYLRYCDDFIILGSSREDLEEFIFVISKFLCEKLALLLHPDKISIRKWREGIDFLGYVTLPYHSVLRTKTKKRIFKRIQDKNFNDRSLQSYFGVLKHCNGHKLKKKILDFLK